MTHETPAGRQTWMTLGAAAELLGVSESTVRRWSDSGEIRSFRTRGGHRRVLEEDLRQLVGAQQPPSRRDPMHVSDIALARVKRRITRGRQTHTLPALENLSESARSRLRLLGRQLVDLFARFVSSGGRKERYRDDARTIGQEYGRLMVSEGIRLSQAITTFNSLRRSLEETASQIASEAGLNVDAAVEAVENIVDLADSVLEGMAEEYEVALAAARLSGRGPTDP